MTVLTLDQKMELDSNGDRDSPAAFQNKRSHFVVYIEQLLVFVWFLWINWGLLTISKNLISTKWDAFILERLSYWGQYPLDRNHHNRLKKLSLKTISAITDLDEVYTHNHNHDGREMVIWSQALLLNENTDHSVVLLVRID